MLPSEQQSREAKVLGLDLTSQKAMYCGHKFLQSGTKDSRLTSALNGQLSSAVSSQIVNFGTP